MAHIPTTVEETYRDIPVREKPKYYPDWTQMCPTCEGHGNFNITLDAYGAGRHFRGCCSNCNGWGWIKPCDHVHEWVEISSKKSAELGIKHWGVFCHVYLCKHASCKEVRVTDSSD